MGLSIARQPECEWLVMLAQRLERRCCLCGGRGGRASLEPICLFTWPTRCLHGGVVVVFALPPENLIRLKCIRRPTPFRPPPAPATDTYKAHIRRTHVHFKPSYCQTSCSSCLPISPGWPPQCGTSCLDIYSYRGRHRYVQRQSGCNRVL